jgi:hypothetical protein
MGRASGAMSMQEAASELSADPRPHQPGVAAVAVPSASSTHARSSSSFELVENESSSCFDAEAFVAAIEPLEAKAGRRMNGPGLAACRHAFSENPDGFRRIALDALARGRNPLALLIKMVGDGDHSQTPPPAEDKATRLRRRIAEVERRERGSV